MSLPLSNPYDLSAVEQFLSTNASLPSTTNQEQIAIAGDETAGMSFSELFSHYLAPEVAKLPNSTTQNGGLNSSFSDSAFTFGGGGAASSANNEFDPSTFMPNIPGSPISPSETGSLSHSAASPMSFADFDDMFNGSNTNGQSDPATTSNEGFAVDPSIFEQLPATFSPSNGQQALPGISLPALEQPSFAPSSSLPPLPDLSSFELPIPPPPSHSNYQALNPTPAANPVQPALTASGRPKRNVSSMIIQEEDEEEEEQDMQEQDEDEGSAMSDGSEMTTTSRRRSSRPPTTKKTRSDSSSAPAKKLPKTSVLPLASEGLYKTSSKSNLPPVPLWKDKPDEEEYKKLSSKEKRQLRNKISARNFRHRRKEYITTLEEEISTRDTLITNLQDQVSTLQTDNSSLKSEVTLLKSKWQELLDKMSSLAGSTPAPSTTSSMGVGLGVNPSKAIAGGQVQVKEEEEAWALDSPGSSASPLPSTSTDATARRTRASNGIQRPNLSKDLPPRRSNSSWNPNAFGGGFQSVHTTLVPDFSSLASQLTNKASFAPSQSFNPNLNNLTSEQLNELPSLTSHLRQTPSALPPSNSSNSAFQDLFSTNPFYLNHASLESQRAGLYSRIAHNTAGIAQAKKQAPSSTPADGQLPLPTGFRPAFFSTSSSVPTKSTEKYLPSTSSTAQELLAFQSPSSAPTASHQDAYQFKLAQMAQETLFSRMTGAFLSAFSGSSSTSSLDSNKVKDVISGRATLQVVPVESKPEQKKGLEALEERMASLNLSKPQSQRARSLSPSFGVRRSCSFDEVVSRWTIKSEEK
ncbi:hypothetical protein JCM3765_001076 [Sporobolomyces pararoseus]